MNDRTGDPRDKWQGAEVARAYGGTRFRSPRRRERDPRLVRAALARHLGSRRPAAILDVPCGTGRLRPALSALACSYVGLDVSAAMLAAAEPGASLVRGDVHHLPFPEGAFPVVVSCRLLHHQRDPERFHDIVGELVRVSSGLIVCSFWDAGALPERWRVRPRRDARVAHSRRFVRGALEAAGADLLGFRHSFRFVSRQTFAVARKRGGR